MATIDAVTFDGKNYTRVIYSGGRTFYSVETKRVTNQGKRIIMHLSSKTIQSKIDEAIIAKADAESAVLGAAERANYWHVWDTVSRVRPDLINNMEMHYCQARNCEDEGQDPNHFAISNGFKDNVEMFRSVAGQALEDAGL